MVEQRSPKPLVACSNRVSPAKNSRTIVREFYLLHLHWSLFALCLSACTIQYKSIYSFESMYEIQKTVSEETVFH